MNFCWRIKIKYLLVNYGLRIKNLPMKNNSYKILVRKKKYSQLENMRIIFLSLICLWLYVREKKILVRIVFLQIIQIKQYYHDKGYS